MFVYPTTSDIMDTMCYLDMRSSPSLKVILKAYSLTKNQRN